MAAMTPKEVWQQAVDGSAGCCLAAAELGIEFGCAAAGDDICCGYVLQRPETIHRAAVGAA